MPMSGPNLWPQSERVAPIPPPIVERKAGRIRKLRRVNPIEAEDNGKKKVCKVRKYLCKTCGLPGHNSRVCKKKDNQAGADPGQQSMDEDSHVPPLKTRISQRSNYIATGIRLQPRVHVGAVGIRAPPPMASPSMQYVPFALPARTRTAPVFFKAGQKFINLKDVEKQ